MPRITLSTHYQRHQFLRTAWHKFPKLYATLPLRAQWQLHEFYLPSKELAKAELIDHIRHLVQTKPALVQQTGKHVRLLQKVFRYTAKELNTPRSEWYKALARPIQYHTPSQRTWRPKTVIATPLLRWRGGGGSIEIRKGSSATGK